MYYNGVTTRWVATPHTNLPFTICRSKKRIYEGNPGVKSYKTGDEIPKGTFYMIVKNGQNPIEVLINRKKKVI
jgi:hypothetical protein